MEEQIQALQQQVANLTLMMQTQAQLLQEAQAATIRAQDTARTAAGSSRGGRLDPRVLHGMPEFNGSPKAFPDWLVTAKAYAGLVDERLTALITAVTDADVESALNETLTEPNDRGASVTLYNLLLNCCRGTAKTKVINAGDGEGLQAWRSLVTEFDPQSLTHQAGQLLKILQWNFSGDITERLESWEREIARYEANTKETIPQNLKIGFVLRQLEDGSLKTHLLLNAGRLRTWAGFRAEIVSVRQAMTSSSPVPMDIGSLGKGKGNPKGKGKGKGKDSGKSHWGRLGQQEAERRQRTFKGKGKEKPKGKGKSKGKGKGQEGKGQGGRLCYICDSAHHLSW